MLHFDKSRTVRDSSFDWSSFMALPYNLEL